MQRGRYDHAGGAALAIRSTHFILLHFTEHHAALYAIANKNTSDRPASTLAGDTDASSLVKLTSKMPLSLSTSAKVIQRRIFLQLDPVSDWPVKLKIPMPFGEMAEFAAETWGGGCNGGVALCRGSVTLLTYPYY